MPGLRRSSERSINIILNCCVFRIAAAYVRFLRQIMRYISWLPVLIRSTDGLADNTRAPALKSNYCRSTGGGSVINMGYERYEGDAMGRESASFLGFSGRKKNSFFRFRTFTKARINLHEHFTMITFSPACLEPPLLRLNLDDMRWRSRFSIKELLCDLW